MNEKYEMVEWSQGCGWDKGFSLLRGPNGFEKLVAITKEWAGAAGWEVVNVAVAELNRLLAENNSLKEDVRILRDRPEPRSLGGPQQAVSHEQQ